jgi:hypothetical protein
MESPFCGDWKADRAIYVPLAMPKGSVAGFGCVSLCFDIIGPIGQGI